MKNIKIITEVLLKAINVSKKGFLKQVVAFLIFITSLTFYTPIMTERMIATIYTGNLSLILRNGFIAILSIIAICTIQYFNNVHADMNSYKVINGFCKQSIFDINKIADIDLKKFESGDIFERIDSYSSAPMQIISHIFLFISAVISLLIYSFGISNNYFFLIILALFNYLANFAINKNIIKAIEKIEKYKREKEAIRIDKSYDFIKNVDFYLSNGIEEKTIQHIINLETDLHKANNKKAVINTVKESITDFSSNFQFIILIVYCGYKYIRGLIVPSYVFAANTFLSSLKSIFNRLLNSISKMPEMVIPIERFNQIKNIKSHQEQQKLEQLSDEIIIDIKDVDLIRGQREILSSININIKVGDKIALVGNNGSGKTTLLKTILGSNSFQNGEITYNSDYICSKEEIAFIPANSLLYTETVKDNILMASENDEQITDICNRFVSRRIEELSGGQKQKCNVARAINKKAKLILADEPTSNLDSESAETVVKEIIKSSDTCIVTIHDSSLLHYFTRVIRLQNGKVIN